MDINGISSATIASISDTSTPSGNAVAVSLLRKALDIQASAAAQLIASATASAPTATDVSSPIGQNINVTA